MGKFFYYNQMGLGFRPYPFYIRTKMLSYNADVNYIKSAGGNKMALCIAVGVGLIVYGILKMITD